MVYRLLIFLIFFNINFSYANIIYDKNEITITELEIDKYIDFYEANYKKNISNNQAIKNIVLIKRTINFLFENNPDFMLVLDKNILSEFSEDITKDENFLNFIRFQKIRYEFINEYFQFNFNVNDLKKVFSAFDDLKLPLSKNNCLTIEKLHKIELDEYFLESFFENLRENPQKITTIIDNESYDICINERLFKTIEYEIFKYIEIKTEGDFDKFIYGKIN